MFLSFFSDEAIATQKKLIFVLYKCGQHHNLREYDSKNQGGRVNRGIAKEKAGEGRDFKERERAKEPLTSSFTRIVGPLLQKNCHSVKPGEVIFRCSNTLTPHYNKLDLKPMW